MSKQEEVWRGIARVLAKRDGDVAEAKYYLSEAWAWLIYLDSQGCVLKVWDKPTPAEMKKIEDNSPELAAAMRMGYEAVESLLKE